MMKKILLVLLASVANSFGIPQRIEYNDVQKIKESLIKFHTQTTTGKYSKRPDVSTFAGTNSLLIAKMDSFGLDRYFAFENNDDVDLLVKAICDGGGMGLSWYYLQDPFKYDLIKIIKF